MLPSNFYIPPSVLHLDRFPSLSKEVKATNAKHFSTMHLLRTLAFCSGLSLLCLDLPFSLWMHISLCPGYTFSSYCLLVTRICHGLFIERHPDPTFLGSCTVFESVAYPRILQEGFSSTGFFQAPSTPTHPPPLITYPRIFCISPPSKNI